MKLSELKQQVDYTLSQGTDLDVVIPNGLPSVGYSGTTNVISASAGIDWDSGQFFIIPEVEMTNK